MATTFLRKIILEELKKVLNEQEALGTGTKSPVFKMGGATETKIYDASSATRQDRQKAMKMAEDSQGRLTFDQALQSVLSSKLGTGAISSGQTQGLEQVIAAATENKSVALKQLQKELVKVGFLKPKDIDGIPGPKTLNAINVALDYDLTLKDLKKLPVNDMKLIIQDLTTTDKTQLAKRKANPQSLSASSIPSDGELPTINIQGGTPSPPMSQKEKDERLRKLGADPNMFKSNIPPDMQQEALVRAISKLLKKL